MHNWNSSSSLTLTGAIIPSSITSVDFGSSSSGLGTSGRTDAVTIEKGRLILLRLSSCEHSLLLQLNWLPSRCPFVMHNWNSSSGSTLTGVVMPSSITSVDFGSSSSGLGTSGRTYVVNIEKGRLILLRLSSCEHSLPPSVELAPQPVPLCYAFAPSFS